MRIVHKMVKKTNKKTDYIHLGFFSLGNKVIQKLHTKNHGPLKTRSLISLKRASQLLPNIEKGAGERSGGSSILGVQQLWPHAAHLLFAQRPQQLLEDETPDIQDAAFVSSPPQLLASSRTDPSHVPLQPRVLSSTTSRPPGARHRPPSFPTDRFTKRAPQQWRRSPSMLLFQRDYGHALPKDGPCALRRRTTQDNLLLRSSNV